MLRKSFFLTLAFLLCALPEAALASGGLTEFAGPLEKFLDTLRGPIMAVVLVFMLIIAAISYWWRQQEELSGMMKNLLGIIFVMSVAVFSGTLVSWLFPSVSGALV